MWGAILITSITVGGILLNYRRETKAEQIAWYQWYSSHGQTNARIDFRNNFGSHPQEAFQGFVTKYALSPSLNERMSFLEGYDSEYMVLDEKKLVSK